MTPSLLDQPDGQAVVLNINPPLTDRSYTNSSNFDISSIRKKLVIIFLVTISSVFFILEMLSVYLSADFKASLKETAANYKLNG